MPINRLLKDKRTPEEIELLNKAFNHALNLLGVVDRNDPLCDMVARKVIEVGTTGISEPREIAEMAVVRIGLRLGHPVATKWTWRDGLATCALEGTTDLPCK